ncbi:MAG: YncE family protein [Nitrosospira sp.]
MNAYAGYKQAARKSSALLAHVVMQIAVVGQLAVSPSNAADSANETRQATHSSAQYFEQQGIALEFYLRPPADKPGSPANPVAAIPVAGSNATATFRASDARTGQPLAGMRPKAWFSARLSEQVANETECKDKIRSLLAGQISTRADIDLNSYLLLTLNHDKTVSVINPQVSFNTTKLESVIALPGNGADWTLSGSKEFLYVSMPSQDSVAIINTVSRKLISVLAMGAGTRPTRMAQAPDGRTLWVALDGSGAVAVIDMDSNSLVSQIAVGKGLHTITFNTEGTSAFVSNSSDSTVSVIDTGKLTRVAEIKVGQAPVAMVFSPASRALYVASSDGGNVSVIDAESLKLRKTIALAPGIAALNFEPEGRFAVVANRLDHTISVIDAAIDSVIASTHVVKEPDQITFTQRYSYVRGVGSDGFSLIDLNELRKGRLVPVDIQAGRQPPSAEPQQIGVASMIAPTPEGNSVVIANAPDRMLYFYQEGMMATMGAFSNYKRMPRGVMLLDRSLTETAPGVYSAPVAFTRGGRFDVPVLIDQPRIATCFQITVADALGEKKSSAEAAIIVEALSGEEAIAPHQDVTLRFRIVDSSDMQAVTGLKDVQALVFEPPGLWQQRRSVKDVGDGIYALELVFPHTGLFKVMLSISSRGISHTKLPAHDIRVGGRGTAAGAGRKPDQVKPGMDDQVFANGHGVRK